MQSNCTSRPLSRLRTSVAICTYNGAQYIERQLTSILKQDVPPDEILICDDASNDDTRKLIDSFTRKQECLIRLIVNDSNIGYTKNFEKAISLTTGDIIFFSDQDDVWFSNKIELVCQLFEQNPDIAGITHDGHLVDQDLRWHGTTKSSQIIRGYGANSRTITGALSAIRRSYIGFFLPIPSGVKGHDTWLSYIFTVFQNRWLHSELCLQDVRRHSANTSEWIVNSLKPVNKLKVLRSQISTDVALVYTDRRLMNEALRSRLCGETGVKDLFSCDEVSRALSFLSDELNAINTREFIAGIGKGPQRSMASLSFWAKGGYKYFNGLKSLARDILR